MAKQNPQRADYSPIEALVARLDRWPRPLRIGLNSGVAVLLLLVVGYALSLVLDVSPEADNTLYFALVGGLGIALYALGWGLLVGFDWNPDIPWRAQRAAAYYLLSGLFALIVIFLALLAGLVYSYLIPV